MIAVDAVVETVVEIAVGRAGFSGCGTLAPDEGEVEAHGVARSRRDLSKGQRGRTRGPQRVAARGQRKPITESESIAGAVGGSRHEGDWTAEARNVPFNECKFAQFAFLVLCAVGVLQRVQQRRVGVSFINCLVGSQ